MRIPLCRSKYILCYDPEWFSKVTTTKGIFAKALSSDVAYLHLAWSEETRILCVSTLNSLGTVSWIEKGGICSCLQSQVSFVNILNPLVNYMKY
jgi:hypothetical protein